MKGGRFRPDLAASVLITAAYATDAEACKQYGVSDRTLRSWRRRLAEDPAFADLFRTKSAEVGKAWTEKLPVALAKSLECIAEAADAIRKDPTYLKNPMSLAAVAGAMKLVADVLLTSKVLDARLADPNRPANGLPEQVPAETDTSQYAN